MEREIISAQKKYGRNWEHRLSNLQIIWYVSATGDEIPVHGVFQADVALSSSSVSVKVPFNVSKLPSLNLIGRSGIASLDIDVQKLILSRTHTTTAKKGEGRNPDSQKGNTRSQTLSCMQPAD